MKAADELVADKDAATLRMVLEDEFATAHTAQEAADAAKAAKAAATPPPAAPKTPPPAPLAGNGGGGSGAPPLNKLNQWAQENFGKDVPKLNYGGMGALPTTASTERVFLPGQNLLEIEKASKPVFRAALPAASANAISTTLLMSALPAIRKSLEGSGVSWDELNLYYVESALRGKRERWQGFRDEADNSTDQDLEQSFQPSSDGSPSQHLFLLGNLEGRAGFEVNLAQQAVALADAKDWDTLRELLVQSYGDAADRVATMPAPDGSDPDTWFETIHDGIRTNPKLKEADKLYGELVEKPMSEAHAVNEGVFSNALGPSGRYIPLTPMNKAVKPGPGRRLAYRTPPNAANAFATGLSPAYDPSIEPLAKKVTYAMRSNYKAALFNTMRTQGWLKQPKVARILPTYSENLER